MHAPLRKFHLTLNSTAHTRPSARERMGVGGVCALLAMMLATTWLNERWVTGMWLLLILSSGAVAAWKLSTKASLSQFLIVGMALLLPFIGMAQFVFGLTSYRYATLLGILDWLALAASLLVGFFLFRSRLATRYFRHALWWIAILATGLELSQIFNLGRYTVLSTGYPLFSSNLYAELSELLMPVILWDALRERSRQWAGLGLAAVLFSTTVASGARLGTAILILEAGALLIWQQIDKLSQRRLRIGVSLSFVMLCVALAFLQGTGNLSNRLKHDSFLEDRGLIAKSSVRMANSHPVLGYGLGTFPVVYPKFASFDNGYFINHAHNDYLEIASETGWSGLVVWIGFLSIAIYRARRSQWAIGLIGLMIHSFTDFPIARLPVLILLAFLLAAAIQRTTDADSLSNERKDVNLEPSLPHAA